MASLFWHRNPYDIVGTDELFMKKVRENMLFQYNNCSEYKSLLMERGWSEKAINELKSLSDIPFLPTLYRDCYLSLASRFSCCSITSLYGFLLSRISSGISASRCSRCSA